MSSSSICPSCISAFALAFVTACGSAAVPNERLADTKAAIRAAEVAEARGVPRASLHLKYAEDGIKEATKEIREENYQRASRILDRAKKDAELALYLTREAQTRARAESAIERLNELSQSAHE